MISRRALIALGEKALEEIYDPYGDNSSSYVFEDAFREYAPASKQYLADYIKSQRGYSGERLHIGHALQWLEHQPQAEMVSRAQKKVEKILNRAWKAKVLTRANEDVPFIRYMDNHISHGLRLSDSNTRKKVQYEIEKHSFQVSSHTNPAFKRLARRVADAIYDEYQRSITTSQDPSRRRRLTRKPSRRRGAVSRFVKTRSLASRGGR